MESQNVLGWIEPYRLSSPNPVLWRSHLFSPFSSRWDGQCGHSSHLQMSVPNRLIVMVWSVFIPERLTHKKEHMWIKTEKRKVWLHQTSFTPTLLFRAHCNPFCSNLLPRSVLMLVVHHKLLKCVNIFVSTHSNTITAAGYDPVMPNFYLAFPSVRM